MKANALERTLNERSDKDFLRSAVDKHQKEVYKIGTDRIIRAHAHAAVYVCDLERALTSFDKIDHNDYERAVVGLMAYDDNQVGKALRHLTHVKAKIPPVRIALSVMKATPDHFRESEHRKLLNPVIESPAANNYLHTLLGVHAFNSGDFSGAEEYFSTALGIENSSENQLNLMHARFKQGRHPEVWAMAGKYLHDSKSELTPEGLTNQLSTKKLDFPGFKVDKGKLYKLLR